MIQKLIDAYELEREMYRKCIDTNEEIEKGRAKWDSGLWIRYKVFEDSITLAPRVDPVKHGHWIERTDYVGDAYYDCSACGESWTTIEGDPCDNGMDYCPKCGSRMDEPMQPNNSNALDALERGKQCD